MQAPRPDASRRPDASPRAGFAQRWAGPAAAGLALAGALFLALTVSVWLEASPGWGYDFRAYFDAAVRLVATGTPYQAETLAGPFRPGPGGLYLYSPVPAMLFVPFTALSFETATLVWLALRLVILVAACALMPITRTLRLAMLGVAALSAPVVYDLDLGNVSLIVTFLAVLTWRWLDRPAGSVALAAALTMRPTMLFICGWWLLRGLWRPIAWTVVSAAVIFAASLPFVGLERWLEYLTVLRHVSDVMGVPANVDLGSAVLLLGGPPSLASLSLLGGYALAGAAVLLSLRRDRELSYVVTLLASLLVAPLLWDHYLTHLLLPAAFLAARGHVWGLALPLLGWLPPPALPFVAIAGMLLPFLAPDRGAPAGTLLDRVPALGRVGERLRLRLGGEVNEIARP